MSRRREDQRPLPKPPDMKAGARLAFTNSARHLRVAQVLGKERLFGCGLAHIVLSLEEQAKAWMLTFGAMGIDLPKKELREILTKHDSRQGFSFSILLVGLIRFMGMRAASRVQKRHKVEDYPPELKDEWVKELEGDFDSLASKRPAKDPVVVILKWIAEANDLKNRGLYVDFDGKDWNTPRDVTEKQFMVGLEIAKRLFNSFGRTYRKALNLNLKAEEGLNLYVADQLANQPKGPDEAFERLITIALGPTPTDFIDGLVIPEAKNSSG